jgi:hypothetical protein
VELEGNDEEDQELEDDIEHGSKLQFSRRHPVIAEFHRRIV